MGAIEQAARFQQGCRSHSLLHPYVTTRMVYACFEWGFSLRRRSCNGNVTGFAVNTSTGAPTQLGSSPCAAVRCPHQVVMNPTGHFLYVTNNTPSGRVGGFSTNQSTGTLTQLTGSPFSSGAWVGRSAWKIHLRFWRSGWYEPSAKRLRAQRNH